jgi:hypothetical protein
MMTACALGTKLFIFLLALLELEGFRALVAVAGVWARH